MEITPLSVAAFQVAPWSVLRKSWFNAETKTVPDGPTSTLSSGNGNWVSHQVAPPDKQTQQDEELRKSWS